MRTKLERDRFARIEGPAFVKMVQGCVFVKGKSMKPTETLVVPKGKSTVLEAEELSEFEVKLGEGASMQELEMSLTPPEWKTAIERILSKERPLTIVALGDVDSGKTTFCNMVANKSFKLGFKTAIIDKDLGQSDLGPPTTIGLGYMVAPTSSLDKVPLVDAHFVGGTSPSGLGHRIIVGLRNLAERARSEGCDVLIVNTSGWIHGWGARELKLSVLSLLKPQVIAAIQRQTEVEHILKSFADFVGVDITRLPAPKFTRPRSIEERRTLREVSYNKYLKNASTRVVALDKVGVAYSLYGTGFTVPSEEMARIREIVGEEVVYAEKGGDFLLVVLPRVSKLSDEVLEKLKAETGKTEVMAVREGFEHGTLVGLLGRDMKYAGIGVIEKIDYRKHVANIFTPVKSDIGLVAFGQIKLKGNGYEVMRREGWPL